ncbi:hypothetical protein PHLGIDRAFT_293918 [Phlebiopsis gigantea 11061_1 CR5-6]|uniref:Uncharacterized protein n=1 Tax=Phlebiopsis gigantea (strain 11061_1 CR5-6) TaxID=745531 RepID=A0A0C3PBS3_PHLG1|nr:hypothetical protein PHLGIDRAFT_293918 [Phlebiopsis gigantea 11061_1 CR5-6]
MDDSSSGRTTTAGCGVSSHVRYRRPDEATPVAVFSPDPGTPLLGNISSSPIYILCIYINIVLVGVSSARTGRPFTLATTANLRIRPTPCLGSDVKWCDLSRTMQIYARRKYSKTFLRTLVAYQGVPLSPEHAPCHCNMPQASAVCMHTFCGYSIALLARLYKQYGSEPGYMDRLVLR